MNEYIINKITVNGNDGKIEFEVENLNTDYKESYAIDVDGEGQPYLKKIIRLKRK